MSVIEDDAQLNSFLNSLSTNEPDTLSRLGYDEQAFKWVIKCLGLFVPPGSTSSEAMNALCLAILNFMNEMNTLTNVLHDLKNDLDLIKKFPQLLSLFKSRRLFLIERIGTHGSPVFTWSMTQARLKKLPAIEKFLHGSEQSIDYDFGDREKMKKFIKAYTDSSDKSNVARNGFSIEIVELSNVTSVVRIEKTKKLHEYQCEVHNQYVEELNSINSFLDSIHDSNWISYLFCFACFFSLLILIINN